jgi:hypothetical protein
MPSFVEEIQNLIEWLNKDAPLLSKEDIIDKVKVSMLTILRKFLSYPHCSNFSMMPENAI